MSRTFTEDEARRIFARAARRQHAATPPQGLRAADLVAIARDIGLDPSLVAAEADAERVQAESDDGRRVRLVPSEVTDGEWERIVDLLRAEAGGPGVAQQVGRRREWAAPGAMVGGVPVASVEMTPAEGGTRLSIIPRKTSSPRNVGLFLGGLMMVNAALYGWIMTMAGNQGPALVVAAVCVALAALLAVGMPAWMRRREAIASDRIDALLDRIDLAARADDAPAGRIDAGLLDLEAPSTPALRRPHRDRA